MTSHPSPENEPVSIEFQEPPLTEPALYFRADRRHISYSTSSRKGNNRRAHTSIRKWRTAQAGSAALLNPLTAFCAAWPAASRPWRRQPPTGASRRRPRHHQPPSKPSCATVPLTPLTVEKAEGASARAGATRERRARGPARLFGAHHSYEGPYNGILNAICAWPNFLARRTARRTDPPTHTPGCKTAQNAVLPISQTSDAQKAMGRFSLPRC